MVMRSSEPKIGVRRTAVAAACALSLAMLTAPAYAQDAPASAAAPPAESAAVRPAPVRKPGVFESIGRFFDEGAAKVREHLRGAKRRIDEFGDEVTTNQGEISEQAAKVGQGAAKATKDAVDAVVSLPTARVMEGREQCAIAPNGAPDCLSAAQALCRKHGFASGKSMEFTSAEECPPKVLLGQETREQCRTVTFISRAMCQ